MHALDVSSADFQRAVIDASHQVPVVVDFWAPWCGPCRALKPVLEKLAAEYQGRFILAKVNSDENQELSARFGVRGIPNVKAFHRGQIVDEFSGALPEGAVREWLDRLIPSPAEELRLSAAAAAQQGDIALVQQLLDQAATLEPDNDNITFDRAGLLFVQKNLTGAQQMLARISAARSNDADVSALRTRIDAALKVRDLPAPEALHAAIERNPDDLTSRLQLAEAHIALAEYPEALAQLLEIIRRDRQFQDDAARKKMIAVFQLLGDQHPLTRDYRRRLSTLLT